MDPFVRRLVERLNDPSRPLSRNRHFHTFETKEGQQALKTSRRLLGLQRDILTSVREGSRPTVQRTTNAAGEVEVEVAFERVKGKRISRLQDAEFELLLALPGVGEALGRGS
jgi:hypothetical protein